MERRRGRVPRVRPAMQILAVKLPLARKTRGLALREIAEVRVYRYVGEEDVAPRFGHCDAVLYHACSFRWRGEVVQWAEAQDYIEGATGGFEEGVL